jgi:hypothetical protein
VGTLIVNGLAKLWDNYRNGPGRKYVAANPYFKVDTGKLRDYAFRVNKINERLKDLDYSLRKVFWEVSPLDMWQFGWVNLLTSESWTLDRVKAYLNNTAQNMETIENTARGYIGG